MLISIKAREALEDVVKHSSGKATYVILLYVTAFENKITKFPSIFTLLIDEKIFYSIDCINRCVITGYEIDLDFFFNLY